MPRQPRRARQSRHQSPGPHSSPDDGLQPWVFGRRASPDFGGDHRRATVRGRAGEAGTPAVAFCGGEE
ncbi:hypothetical protein H6P81_015885 [Aristolochia fimbriata]|uniref:Uncharacterized protein n=1 Tax=Aristolochia fimbriata TaxID=158543 RepID=A0AAV7E6Q2_ARIFI|nr:hypothetical protein H6P81_015885 [Aristolochia fimbriata]